MVFSLNQILNVSLNLQTAIVPQNKGGHLSFTAAYSLISEKDWPADFAKL